MTMWWKKLRRSNVVNVEGIRCWKCSVGQMLLVMYALLIGKNGQIVFQKKLGNCRGNMGKNIRRRKRCIIKNIIIKREVECEVCRCKVRKCNWLRHVRTRKHRDGVGNGGGGGDMDVDAGGAGGRS